MPLKNALANVSFDDFANMLMDLGTLGSPAELHGLLCGQLSTGQQLDTDGWLMLASTQLQLDIGTNNDRLALIGLYEQSLAQLSGFSFEFQPLLPTDETSLELRTVALGQWCSGFLSGFGLALDYQRQKLSDEVNESIADLAQISQIKSDEMVDQTAEQSYMELVEYVRLAATMVYSEFNVPKHQSGNTQSLH
jgi:uncharacterized protein YgfB (UPF0149 family)